MPIAKTCVVCMSVFHVPPVREHTATTCSRACKAALKSQGARALWAEKTCPECGKTYQCPKRDEDRRKFCSEECKASGESRKWAGYESTSRNVAHHTDGYLLEYAPRHPFAVRGYVLQHRLIMERALRASGEAKHFMVEIAGQYYLLREIEVHHRNERKDDNREANLVACTLAAHRAIHRGEPVGRMEAWPLDGLQVAEVVRAIRCLCEQCGGVFERTPSEIRRGRDRFCSMACYDKTIGGNVMPRRVENTCNHCGSKFQALRSRVLKGTSKFCSDECRLEGLHQARRDSKKPQGAKSPRPTKESTS